MQPDGPVNIAAESSARSGKHSGGQRKERRLALLLHALPLLAGKLLEPEQAQSEQVAGAGIAAIGEEEYRPRLNVEWARAQ